MSNSEHNPATWQPSTTPVPDNFLRVSNREVMAWATDKTTGEPRYVFDLDKSRRGANCGCICVSCKADLLAINAAKSIYIQRPHFRHPAGTERQGCLIMTARYSLARQLADLEEIDLPQYQKKANVVGLSGTSYEVWRNIPPRRINIRETNFYDTALALLTLDDGTQLVVELVGSLAEVEETEPLLPTITIVVDDPHVAGMSPDELKSRLTLLMTDGCWRKHIDDQVLARELEHEALDKAIQAYDWLPESALPEFEKLSPTERREGLLHFAVKEILKQEGRIKVPYLGTNDRSIRFAEFNRYWPAETIISTGELTLNDIKLEQPMEGIIPDVVATIHEESGPKTLLIEVTVHHPLTEEKLTKIRQRDIACLEITLTDLGGRISQVGLQHLVVDELSIKSWIHHPRLHEISAEQTYFQQASNAWYLDTPDRLTTMRAMNHDQLIQHYLDSVTRYGDIHRPYKDEGSEEFELKARIKEIALRMRGSGYYEIDDSGFLRMILRILTIKLNRPMGTAQPNTAAAIGNIFLDGKREKTFHTIYLMALRAFAPRLPAKTQINIQKWRQRVLDSLNNDEPTYKRDTKYDQVLGTLFPDMRELLAKPFGKATREPR